MSGLAEKNTLPLLSLLNNSNEVRCFSNIKASPFIELLQEETIHSTTGLHFPAGQRTIKMPTFISKGSDISNVDGYHSIEVNEELKAV